jgi:CheY-like chemotaxis protein
MGTTEIMPTKVLIVEDDQLIQKMYQKIFTFEGYDVVVASDGEEGLAKVQTDAPGVVLLDIMMPKMNGMEVLRHLKADQTTKNIPVIMLSNLAGDGDVDTAISSGAMKYIIKSEHDPQEVVDMVGESIKEL